VPPENLLLFQLRQRVVVGDVVVVPLELPEPQLRRDRAELRCPLRQIIVPPHSS
jgi:hypothetical protein